MSDQTESPAETLDPAATDATNENARDGVHKRRDPKEPAAVVGLGASAGGIAVLQQFFADMPPDTGLAFVVVMHLSPEHESHLANILQSKTAMPVTQVTEPLKVEPNHVYVIPPNKQLTFNDSMLTLVEPQQAAGRRVTIDLFFRTLAQSYGQRSIGVILTGTDSDGVIGLKHVRAQGGVTVAQDPKEAEYPSMPVTAIATGMVDWVLPVGELAPKLVQLVRNEHAMKLPPEIPEATEPDVKVLEAAGGETVSDETRDQRDENALQEVLRVLRRHTGHDFSHYKRATLLRRIARRMQVNSLESIPQYLDFFRQHPAEASELLQDLLISVTHFFRDQAAFAALEAHVPQLFAGKRKDDQLRVWVAGSATGEEAYSIAMLLAEHAEKLESPPTIQIFATDIDEQAVQTARSGIYPRTVEADVSPERLRRFFEQDHGRYRIRKNLREKVLFAAHNVLSDAPFSNLDLVSCRNLLIYLTPKAQEQVFEVAHFALRSGGLLFIGGSENTSTAQLLFAPVDTKHRLYVRRSVPRPTWKVPMVPRRADDGQQQPRPARLRALPAITSAAADGAAAHTRESALAGQDRRAMLFGELHLKLLEQYAAPSVVVNEAHDIVHLSEHAGRYLHFTGGEPTANLPKVIHPALRLELRTALFRAGQTKAAVNASPVTVATASGTEIITLCVRPVQGDLLEQGFYLVTFAKTEEAPATIHALPPPAPDAEGITGAMQAEIESLKRQLAELAEQYELSSEELKASNEELQAMNEEMRSATEELETSKEELQSINEELVTVNNELKNNVEELSKSNADLNNLMSSTDIGTIFLDRQLRIDRFTPSAQKIFNLIPADVGRPISDITSKLAYDGVFADAQKVLENLQPIEREMPLHDGAWLMSRIAPYRTADDRIAGIVATFVDITRRKRAEDELRVSEEKFRSLFTSMDEAYYVLEVIFDAENRPLDYRVLESNPAFEKLTGLKNAVGKRVRELVPEIEDRWIEVYGQVALTGVSGRFDGPVGGLDGRWYDGYAFRVGGAESRQVAVVFSDITDRKRAEATLRESEERHAFLLKLSDALRPLNDPVEIQEAASRVLGEHIGASIAYYIEVEEADGETYWVVRREYRAPGMRSLIDRYRASDYGNFIQTAMREGRTLVVPDIGAVPGLTAAETEAFRSRDSISFALVPLIKETHEVAAFVILQKTLREWTPMEVALLQETAERTWAAVARAQAEMALRESEARIAADLAGMRRLYELQSQLANQNDLKKALEDVLAVACEFTGTDRGCVQLLSKDREKLEMFVWQGYADDGPFISFFRHEGLEVGCEVARVHRQRLIIEDTVGFVGLEGTEAGAAAAAEGIRAAQSTPMASRAGETIGVISTQFREPHRPSEHQLRLMDMLSWTAAEFIERHLADAALRESEARLRRTLEIETVGVIFFNTDGAISDANGAFLQMSGYKREDLAAGLLRWDQMTPPEFMAASLNAIEEFKTAGKTTTYEKQYIRKDGTRWWGLFSASRLTDELGVEFILDVSDRKATEQALAASEARFRSVADNVPQVIWTNAPAGEANYFNRRWYEYTGLSYEESAGPGWQKIVHPDDAVASIERWQEALGTGAIFDVEYRLRGADGGYRWFIGRNVPVRGADGQVISWFGSATDIDDYKQAQQKLAETEERFRVLVEGAHDYAMFLLDTENLITFWSAGAERVFGWSREEAIGQNGEMIFIPEDKAKGEAQKEIDTALGSGRAPDRRFHLRKDGTVFWTDGVLMRLDNADGSLRGFAKVARDASDQRAIEDALRHARDEMEQRVLERTRDLLATNTELERTMTQRQQLEQELLDISEREKRRIGEDLHDMICQELTATALFLKSAAKKIGPEHEGAAATLDESAQIVNRNVGMARDMARGLQPAELTGGTLRQALKSLADQACEGSEIKCHFKAGRGVRVSDDTVALHIYRVTQEAVKNAVKHARAKNILITLDKDKDHVCVSVEDDGKGFNPARRSKGLGLHIMRYRANALGGELKIERRRSGGMEVRCKIPQKR